MREPWGFPHFLGKTEREGKRKTGKSAASKINYGR